MNISKFISHVERIKYIATGACISCAACAGALLDSPTPEAQNYFFVAAVLFGGATCVANSLLRAAKMRRFKIRRAKRRNKELRVS